MWEEGLICSVYNAPPSPFPLRVRISHSSLFCRCLCLLLYMNAGCSSGVNIPTIRWPVPSLSSTELLLILTTLHYPTRTAKHSGKIGQAFATCSFRGGGGADYTEMIDYLVLVSESRHNISEFPTSKGIMQIVTKDPVVIVLISKENHCYKNETPVLVRV